MMSKKFNDLDDNTRAVFSLHSTYTTIMKSIRVSRENQFTFEK